MAREKQSVTAMLSVLVVTDVETRSLSIAALKAEPVFGRIASSSIYIVVQSSSIEKTERESQLGWSPFVEYVSASAATWTRALSTGMQ